MKSDVPKIDTKNNYIQLSQKNSVTKGLMLRVRLFVHVHLLILVYYVFPQLVKRVLIHSLIDLLCMLLQHCGMPLI